MNNVWPIEVQKKLDSVGPGFCLAKFFEVSMHLESGHNHSCVHPRTHRVPESEVVHDPHALHNSQYKQQVRQQMLSGQKPEECSYCWNIESAGAITDRVYFSGNHLKTKDIIETIKSVGGQGRYFPTRVEVSFSTACNFKCVYCSPEVSSRWMNDLDKFGPIELKQTLYTKKWIEDNQKIPIPDDEPNPYIDAFWQWLPESYQHIQNLRLTGGEPLMSPHVFRLLDWIESHPNPDLEFGINSNLGVPEKLMQRFITRLQEISSKNPVKKIVIWTSGESSGPQAEYVRFGLDYKTWLSNIERILISCPTVDIRIMTTYSVLNMGSYMDFLQDIYRLKRVYNKRITLDSHTYLQFPKLMAIDILTQDFESDIAQEVDFIKSQSESSPHEIFQAERCLEYFIYRLQNPWPDLDFYRADFYRYFQQFDQRNSTDFRSVFPRLNDFFDMCGRLV